MLEIIQTWRTKNALRKQLIAFLVEMDKNLELYYVIDQRQFITGGFTMDVWSSVKDLDMIKRFEEIRLYSTTLLDFNKSFEEYKKYELWYSSDLKNKNNENAKILHNLKNILDEKVKPLETVIIKAGQTLEKEMLKLGFISN